MKSPVVRPYSKDNRVAGDNRVRPGGGLLRWFLRTIRPSASDIDVSPLRFLWSEKVSSGQGIGPTPPPHRLIPGEAFVDLAGSRSGGPERLAPARHRLRQSPILAFAVSPSKLQRRLTGAGGPAVRAAACSGGRRRASRAMPQASGRLPLDRIAGPAASFQVEEGGAPSGAQAAPTCVRSKLRRRHFPRTGRTIVTAEGTGHSLPLGRVWAG